MKTVLGAIAVLLFSVTISHAYEGTKCMSIPVKNANTFKIECDAKSVTIVNEEGLKIVKISADIDADGYSADGVKRILSDLIEFKNDGGTVKIEAESCTGTEDSNSSISVSLNVSIPKEMNVKIEGQSGFLSIRNIDANVKIEDISCDIQLENISGSFKYEEADREIKMDRIAGTFAIEGSQ